MGEGENELILKMLKDGRQPAEILEHLPDRTFGAPQTYMTREGLFHLAPPPPVRSKERSTTAGIRRCMCFRRNFGSEWVGSHICGQCKETSECRAA
ncbi:hypothetical protein EGT36_08460 [Agrobacterium sp. FDAARGOS_525]|nr:hypothetical protein EGT36_08460 [Agrobacterium sp. FDAARGOS_525]